MLHQIILKKKIKHIKLREPGGSKNSEKLRKLLLSNKSDFEKKTDLLIYCLLDLKIFIK